MNPCVLRFSSEFCQRNFSPGNSASVSYYAKPENLTRAFSLNRMA
ncbi:hypothetical protein QW060_25185 [Myroides ceti]|uniref:Uncharacterized protein n=1 Tax=Paenimyroides ceti TaxID=395087 RepID=A0ABT8D2T4_9FLAO|nr:hypothetical protein [Paenimyroides ceti]MDN3710172.1 hypothetical protein [Paenimyroides ceti]